MPDQRPPGAPSVAPLSSRRELNRAKLAPAEKWRNPLRITIARLPALCAPRNSAISAVMSVGPIRL